MEVKDAWFGKEVMITGEVIHIDPEVQKEMDEDPFLQAYKNALKEVYGKKEEEE